MAIRIRRIEGTLVALCAAVTEQQKSDLYLDDEIHYALARKFARDRGTETDGLEHDLMRDTEGKAA